MRGRRKQPGQAAAPRHLPSLRLPISLVLIVLLALAPTQARAAFQNDFSGYPSGAQDCLSRFADEDRSGCDGDTVREMNECLCGNGGGFVLNSAACIAKSSPSDLGGTYDTLSTHCSDSQTPLGVSRAQFLAAASSATASASNSATRTTATTSSTTKKATSTTASSATSSSMTTKTTMSNGQTVTETVAVPAETGGSSDKGGPNNTAKTGIIAGACVAGVAILSLLLGFWYWYRKRRAGGPKDELHPMLTPQQQQSGKFGTGAAGMGVAGGNELHDWKSDGKWTPQQQSGTWDASNAGTYNSSWGAQQYQGWGYDPSATPYSQYGGHYQQQQGVFELAGQEPVRPVEVPATPAYQGGYVGQGGGGQQQQQSWGQHQH